MLGLTEADRRTLEALLHQRDVEAAARVRRRRDELQLTQRAVANLAGTTPETVCRVELAQLVPRESLRLAFAYALQVDPIELWPPVSLPDPPNHSHA